MDMGLRSRLGTQGRGGRGLGCWRAGIGGGMGEGGMAWMGRKQ